MLSCRPSDQFCIKASFAISQSSIKSVIHSNATMATTQGYMTDILKTPGFFTSAVLAEGDNPFEQSFKNENESPRQTAFDMGNLQHQQMQRDVNNDDNNMFMQNLNEDTYSPMFPYTKTPQYPNPLSHPQALSPPSSATNAPANWPYNEFHQLPSQKSSLHTITTQSYSAQPYVQYGQVTPPDDQLPSAFDYGNAGGTQTGFTQHSTSQPHLEDSAMSGKRKRSSISANDTSTKPSKRSRKSIGRAKAASQSQSEPMNPEDEKRSKFLERNRVAASKCRQKKKEWTSNLENKARELQASKNQLAIIVTSLKDEVMWLKGEMLKHTGCGCVQIREYLSSAAENITSAALTYKKFESAASPIGSAPNSRPGSTSGNSESRHSRRGEFNLDEIGNGRNNSHSEHFKSENELEALLTRQLAQDTSDKGIANRVGGGSGV